LPHGAAQSFGQSRITRFLSYQIARCSAEEGHDRGILGKSDLRQRSQDGLVLGEALSTFGFG